MCQVLRKTKKWTDHLHVSTQHQLWIHTILSSVKPSWKKEFTTFMKIEKLRIHKPYRQRDKLLIHLLAIKNPHLPAVTSHNHR